MTTYVDTSVVLRLLFGEPEPLTTWMNDQPISSELLRVECLRVIDRTRVSHALDDKTTSRLRAGALDLIAPIALVTLTSDLLERAAEPFPTLLRTLDAIHLATALALRDEYPDITVVTHDAELAVAGRAMGFHVAGSPAS